MVRLNTANGATKSSDSIKVACSQFEEGDFTACVLPSTSSVISVGERCMTYGYGFHWPAWSSKPYLESPSGRIIWLTIENKLPYLYTDDGLSAAPAEEAETDVESDVEYVADTDAKKTEADRVAITKMSASSFYDETGVGRIPNIE